MRPTVGNIVIITAPPADFRRSRSRVVQGGFYFHLKLSGLGGVVIERRGEEKMRRRREKKKLE